VAAVSDRQFTAQALDMIMLPRVRNAFDFTCEPDRVQVRYGDDRYSPNRALAMKFLIA
jgi:hypothetical protein